MGNTKAPADSESDWGEQVITKEIVAMTTQTIEPAAHTTCANCPYFQDFGEPNGRGWCSAFDQMARSYHEQTGACEQEIEAVEAELQQSAHVPEPQRKPAGFVGNEVRVGLLPTQEVQTEFEQGRHHGQQDAAARLHPMYCAPSNAYAAGYVSGYQSVLNSTTQLGQVSAPQEWSVSYDSKWDWYRAIVGSRCIGHGTTHQEAERIAQKYIATNEIIRRQNRVVMKAYSCA